MIQDVRRFDNWFSSHYYNVRKGLRRCVNLDEDAFHDTYLLLRINLLFEREEVPDFEPYFIGHYRKVILKNIRRESRYYHPEDIFFEFLSDSEHVNIEDLLALDRLAHDILDFIKKKFSRNEYNIFKLKHFESKCSYKDLSEYTGISQSQIWKKVNNISNEIRNNQDFAYRNTQLLSTAI